jgi:hypothetical protein
MLEEANYLRRTNRTGIDLKVEIPEGNSGDDRKRLPVEVILQNRRLSAPRPSPAAMRPLA